MRDLYLHVGPVKTGSTYLQNVLWTNRHDLTRQGMLHPLEHKNEMWLATNDLQDCAFVHFDMPEAAGTWQGVCDRVLAHDGRAILSHEVLGLSTEAHIARIVQSFRSTRLHLVVMARSLASVLPSVWQEKVKMVDPDVDWTAYLEAERAADSPDTDSSLIIQRWLAHLPAAQIHVVTVPTKQSAPHLLFNRFAEAINVDTGSWDTWAATNESIDLVQIELVRRLISSNTDRLDRRDLRRLVNGNLVPFLRAADSSKRLRIPSSEREWIDTETRRRVSSIQASGVTVHGSLNDLLGGEDAWMDEPHDATDTEILQEALALLVASHPDEHPDRIDIV